MNIQNIVRAIDAQNYHITHHADEEAQDDGLDFEEIFYSVMLRSLGKLALRRLPQRVMPRSLSPTPTGEREPGICRSDSLQRGVIRLPQRPHTGNPKRKCRITLR